MNKIGAIKIRKAQQIDMTQIYSFEREYIIEHENSQLSKWDSAKDRIMEMLNNNINRMFVATVEGEILGHGYWSFHLDEPCIFSIYISKNHRHIGIATLLMGAMEREIFESGYKKITLSTLETNPAQYLFNKMNYKEVDRIDGWINFVKSIKTEV